MLMNIKHIGRNIHSLYKNNKDGLGNTKKYILQHNLTKFLKIC